MFYERIILDLTSTMLKPIIILQFRSKGVAKSNNDGLTSFSWDPELKSSTGVPLLIIHFPDGRPDDVAILTR